MKPERKLEILSIGVPVKDFKVTNMKFLYPNYSERGIKVKGAIRRQFQLQHIECLIVFIL